MNYRCSAIGTYEYHKQSTWVSYKVIACDYFFFLYGVVNYDYVSLSRQQKLVGWLFEQTQKQGKPGYHSLINKSFSQSGYICVKYYSRLNSANEAMVFSSIVQLFMIE